MAGIERRICQELAEYHGKAGTAARCQGMGRRGGQVQEIFLAQAWNRRLAHGPKKVCLGLDRWSQPFFGKDRTPSKMQGQGSDFISTDAALSRAATGFGFRQGGGRSARRGARVNRFVKIAELSHLDCCFAVP